MITVNQYLSVLSSDYVKFETDENSRFSWPFARYVGKDRLRQNFKGVFDKIDAQKLFDAFNTRANLNLAIASAGVDEIKEISVLKTRSIKQVSSGDPVKPAKELSIPPTVGSMLMYLGGGDRRDYFYLCQGAYIEAMTESGRSIASLGRELGHKYRSPVLKSARAYREYKGRHAVDCGKLISDFHTLKTFYDSMLSVISDKGFFLGVSDNCRSSFLSCGFKSLDEFYYAGIETPWLTIHIGEKVKAEALAALSDIGYDIEEFSLIEKLFRDLR